MPWMWDAGHEWGAWGWLIMPFLMTIVWMPFLLLTAWAAQALFRQRQPGTHGPTSGPGADPDARELARRAYARGEFTRERFLQMIEDLDRTERTTR